MNIDDLTPRRQAIYRYICAFTAQHNYPPTVREIASEVGLASPSTVASHLDKLEEAGLIRRNPNKPRALEVIDPDEKKNNEKAAEREDRAKHNVLTLPVVGRVAAGSPILAEQNIEDEICVPTDITGDAASFILKVSGESMIDAGILDGDYVVVKQQSSPSYNGQIVVAMIDDGATVKRFYREKDCIRLQPENEFMDPIFVRNPTILGVVTGLFRSL